MKRRNKALIVTLPAVLLCLLLVSYAVSLSRRCPVAPLTNYRIQLSVERLDPKNDRVTLNLHSQYSEPLHYHDYCLFRLDVLRNGAWYELPLLPDHRDAPAMALAIGPSETIPLTCRWTDAYGSLPPGQYRIHFTLETTAIPHKQFTVCAEFVL